MMRVKCFDELAIGQAAQFTLPRLLQDLHDGLHQADPTAQQVEVDAKRPRIPFDVLLLLFPWPGQSSGRGPGKVVPVPVG